MTIETGPTFPDLPDARQDLLKLCVEDQWDRGCDMYGSSKRPGYVVDFDTVRIRDAQRRAHVHKLLNEDQLVTGRDYYHAALILQHGDKPEEYLLAHVLATTAAFAGHSPGRWLAAAALDRYLQSIDSVQLFATQGQSVDGQFVPSPTTNLVSTPVRKIWNTLPD